MSGQVRMMRNEVLVEARDPDNVDSLVARVKKEFPDLDLNEVDVAAAYNEKPRGVRVLRADQPLPATAYAPAADFGGPSGSGGQSDVVDLVRTVFDDNHPDGSAHPNYVLVQMYHGRVLPISHPRPASGQPLPYAESPEDPVKVLVIDSAIVEGTAMEARAPGSDIDPIADPDDLDPSALHGTFVAGIVHQVAPGAAITVKALNNANRDAFITDWELGCQLATLARSGEEWDVLNLSLGSLTLDGDPPRALGAALDEMIGDPADPKLLVFAAAGNDGDPDVVYPAAFGAVQAVGAQVYDDVAVRRAAWSNGRERPDTLWAQGVSTKSISIAGTVSFRRPGEPSSRMGDLPPATPVTLNGWACWDGTSFSTAILSGAAAKALAVPGADRASVLATLRQKYDAEDNPGSWTTGLQFCGEQPLPPEAPSGQETHSHE